MRYVTLLHAACPLSLTRAQHPSFATFFDAQVVQARVESIKKAEELDLLRERAAKAEEAARVAESKLAEADAQLKTQSDKAKELEVHSATMQYIFG